MSFLINPYAFLAAGGDFESIATVTVGSGGAANIEFTSIPGTYQHLQIRGIARASSSGIYYSGVRMQMNSDTGSNYAGHLLYGDGAIAAAGATTSQAYFRLWYMTQAAAGASTFAASVIDIVDYASTSKYKTVRVLGGYDNNGAGSTDADKGSPYIASGLWMSSSAITSIKFTDHQSSNFAQHTTFALYGIKAP
jgi:hypothetical protein